MVRWIHHGNRETRSLYFPGIVSSMNVYFYVDHFVIQCRHLNFWFLKNEFVFASDIIDLSFAFFPRWPSFIRLC